MTNAAKNAEPTRPKVIDSLVLVGHAVFWFSAISGVILLYLSMQCIDDCEWSWAKYAYEEEPMLVIFGVALIVGGWVQQQFIHGFSVGLDQLYEIRKNTSK